LSVIDQISLRHIDALACLSLLRAKITDVAECEEGLVEEEDDTEDEEERPEAGQTGTDFWTTERRARSDHGM
jgi:hypothetical protein